MEKELKYIEKIGSIENESIYVKSCFTAMRILAANPRVVKNVEDENSSILERNYILSMVYNMGKADYLREVAEFDFLRTCLVGGESNKYISLSDKKVEKTREELRFSTEGKIEVIPDLVIHDSHNPNSGNTEEGQYLVMEAKTSRRLGEHFFMRDFFKLNLCLAGLHFQNAVSLVINKPASDIDSYIATYKAKGYYWYEHLKSKLRLFIQEKDMPELYRLK